MLINALYNKKAPLQATLTSAHLAARQQTNYTMFQDLLSTLKHRACGKDSSESVLHFMFEAKRAFIIYTINTDTKQLSILLSLHFCYLEVTYVNYTLHSKTNHTVSLTTNLHMHFSLAFFERLKAYSIIDYKTLQKKWVF